MEQTIHLEPAPCTAVYVYDANSKYVYVSTKIE